MGWTGGQYSLWRAALAIAVVTALWTPRPAVDIVLLALALPLAVGWYDRAVAYALAYALLAIAVVGPESLFPPGVGDAVAGRATLAYASLLLQLHASVPGAPFGSLEARGRVDPRGGWQRPEWQIAAFW